MKDRGRGGRCLTDGSWQTMGQEAVCEDKAGFLDACQRLMETEGDVSDVTKMAGTSRMSPISQDEVATAVKGLGESATGTDGITRRTLANIPFGSLATHFNLWIMAERLPEELIKGRSVHTQGKWHQNPMKYRPITIATVVTRCFHKVLADRVADADDNPRQKGFKTGDGVAANTTATDHTGGEQKRTERAEAGIHRCGQSL